MNKTDQEKTQFIDDFFDEKEDPVVENCSLIGLIETLMEFRDQSMIRFIGSSSSLPNLPGMIDLGVFDTFQIPYSCLDPKHYDAITLAANSGAGIIIRGGIARGGPESDVPPRHAEVWDKAELAELAGDMSPAELVLRCTLTHPHCHTTIVGTLNPEHLRQNIAAVERGPLPWDLYDQVRSRVDAVMQTQEP